MTLWTASEITFELLDDLSDDPVVTLRIGTPAGVLLAMAIPEADGNRLILRSAHINGEGQGFGSGHVGMANLLVIGNAFVERFEYDELVVEGAVRTSGRRNGHRPRALRFTRRGAPDSGG